MQKKACTTCKRAANKKAKTHGKPYRNTYRSTKSVKTFTTSKRAPNKQAKTHGNHNGAPTVQPKAQKHAQPSKVRPISMHKCMEMLMERLPTNQIHKNIHNRQTSGQLTSKRKGNHKGAPSEQPKVHKHAQPAKVHPISKEGKR